MDSETGRTFCQVENCGGKPFDGRGPGIPDGRRLCQNCADLAGRERTDYREPSLAVLMGERLAETESELYAGTIAPKPWKRGKQARPARRLKGRRPKCSKAKYSRPFDDPVPWQGAHE